MDLAKDMEISGSQRGSQDSSHDESVESGSKATPTTPFLRSWVNYRSAEISKLEDHTRTGIARIYILSMVSSWVCGH